MLIGTDSQHRAVVFVALLLSKIPPACDSIPVVLCLLEGRFYPKLQFHTSNFKCSNAKPSSDAQFACAGLPLGFLISIPSGGQDELLLN